MVLPTDLSKLLVLRDVILVYRSEIYDLADRSQRCDLGVASDRSDVDNRSERIDLLIGSERCSFRQ